MSSEHQLRQYQPGFSGRLAAISAMRFVLGGANFVPFGENCEYSNALAAGLEAQDEFLKKLESGAYISKWGEGQWS